MPERSVAYLVKGYPRLSELFIASEIERLESLGVTLRLFVVKPSDEDRRHAVVDRVRATPTYLPPTTSLTATSLPRWLRTNLGPFLGPLARVARRHPRGLATAAGRAVAQSVRARKGWRPRKIYVKEFLHAAALADHLDRAPEVTHLHGHFAHGATTITWLAATMTGLPFSFTGHAKDIYQSSLNPAGLLARKMRAAAFVVTCTDANRRHLESIAPGVPVHVVYHGLNADFTPLVDGCGDHGRPESFRIASVGRLVEKKGFDLLVDAVAILRDRGLEVELVIAGEDGEHGPAVRARSTERGLDDVTRFVGPSSQSELFTLFRESSVFALACRVTSDGDRDGIPNVLVEAMAAGVPVVSTDVSGIPELVTDGENGLLVEPESADALADALLRIAKDPALAERLGRAGRATVRERFDGPRLAGRMADLFGMRS